jgi:signal transduction histidine kinase/ligand-binding sensor domain-containing protein
MLKPILLCGLLLAAGGFTHLSFGQAQEFYPFRKYSQADGLSSYNIKKILQDQNGFIWISTQDGLNCFDGKHFQVFNTRKEARYLLNGTMVMDMVEDRKRKLIWLVTAFGGVQAIDINTRSVRQLDQKDQQALTLAGKWLHSLQLTGDTLWIGTYTGLFVYDLNKHSPIKINVHPSIKLSYPLDSLKVGRLAADGAGHIWAFCDGQGVSVFDAKSAQLTVMADAGLLNTYHNGKELYFWNVCPFDDQQVLAATNWGLRQFQITPRQHMIIRCDRFPAAIAQEEVFSAAVDSVKNIWVADARYLYKLDPDKQQMNTISERDFGNETWQTAIFALQVDADGRIWVGSEEGLSYFTPVKPAFEKFYRSHSGDTRIQHAFSIYAANDTIVYCGAANGFYQVNTATNIITQLSRAPSCYLIGQLSPGRILVSNSEGVFIRNGEQALVPAKQLYPELKTLDGDLLCAMIRSNDSVLLLGSELYKGLYVWNTAAKTVTLRNAGNGLSLEDGIIDALFRDRAGKDWIVSTHSVSRYNPATNTFDYFPVKDPATGRYCSILLDGCETDSSYWLAAYGTGLIETDKNWKVKRIISEKEGLCNNGVYKVFSSGDSLILVTSNDGLSILNIRKNKVFNYFEPDGLHSNAFEQFCGYGREETFYAGGVNGFTRMRPRYIFTNPTPPRLYITGIRMDAPSGSRDTSNLDLTQLDIPSNVYQTTVFFSGINLSNPERTVYSYRIAELNEQWSGIGSQNSINLIGLNPGRYTLQIRAANENGLYSVLPVSLALHFLPRWYQTLIFKLSAILLIAALVFALYRYRISQIQRQQQIRRDIAGDLHDDLGSTLNTVKVLTHLAKRDPGRREHLDKIEESLTAASSGLRDMIWVLDDSADNLQGLCERIRKTILPVITANDIKLLCSVEPGSETHTLSKAEKRNLLLIVKEAVNNSIKYAGCKRIDIQLSLRDKRMALQISDDGSGFDVEVASAASTGNGLDNIRYRAKQIGYSASISSSPGKGALIEVVKK